MTKQRLHYIDVAKGILILMVIVHHINNIADRNGIESPMVDYMGSTLSYFFAGFFMQAFFILNGFTSNFNKPFKTFCIGSFKSLMIPYFSFSVIMLIVDYLTFGECNIWITVANGDQTWFFLLDTYWFLSALFIARLIYWIIKHYISNHLVGGGILLSIMILGLILNHIMDGQAKDPAHWNNFFHYRNAMCMAIFLWIGDCIKRYKKTVEPYFKYITLLYILSCASLLFVLHRTYLLPVYTHSTSMPVKYFPLYLFFATSGSITIIWISKILNRNRILEYFGRGSVIVYIMHFYFLTIVIKQLSKLIYPTNFATSATFFILSFVLTSIACAAMIWLMQKPYLRKLIGK